MSPRLTAEVMPIKWVPELSIFDHAPGVALVNPVNCVGVMGAGLARQFRKRFPAMFQEYRKICRRGSLHPGMLHIWYSENERWDIINFPTKVDWRQPATLLIIDVGLEELTRRYWSAGIAIPKLGCGLGGLRWPDVRLLLVEYLGDVEYDVWVHGEKE